MNNAKPLPETNRRGVTTLISHNLIVEGKRTSIRLEKEMWIGCKDIALREQCSIHDLCTEVSKAKKPGTSLTAAMRVFIMAYFQAAATPQGHTNAGHGIGPKIVEPLVQKHASTPYYGLRTFKTVHDT